MIQFQSLFTLFLGISFIFHFNGFAADDQRHVTVASPRAETGDSLYEVLEPTALVAREKIPRGEGNDPDDVVVLQSVVKGIETLSPRRQAFAYYLAMASEAGSELVWKTKTREGAAIRDLLGVLWNHRAQIPKKYMDPIRAYLVRLIQYRGNYDFQNYKLNLVGISFEEFLEVVEKVSKIEGGDALLKLARRLERHLFDPKYYPRNVHRDGKIVIAVSGFYGKGVTHPMLEKAPLHLRENPLNYPYLSDDKLKFRAIRIGGQFSDELRLVYLHLERAKASAYPEEAAVIEEVQHALKLGTVIEMQEMELAWAKMPFRDVLWIPPYPHEAYYSMGARRTFDGLVMIPETDPFEINQTRTMAEVAHEFEKTNPYSDEFRKSGQTGNPHQTHAVQYLMGVGTMQMGIAGLALPNSGGVRSQASHGFTFLNSLKGRTELVKSKVTSEWYDPKYGRFTQDSIWGHRSHVLHVKLHEDYGHNSGKVESGVGDPEQILGGLYNPLEEMRAELAAIYHLSDPRLREIPGILHPDLKTEDEKELFCEYSFVQFFTSVLLGYRELPENAEKITQAHTWGRQVLLNLMFDAEIFRIAPEETSHGEVMRIVMNEGGMDQAREVLAALWKELQRVLSTGDKEGGKKLLNHDPTMGAVIPVDEIEYRTRATYDSFHKRIRDKVLQFYKRNDISLSRPIQANPRLSLRRGVPFTVSNQSVIQAGRLVVEYLPSGRSIDSFIDWELGRAGDIQDTLSFLETINTCEMDLT